MTLSQKHARARKIEREIDRRLARLRTVPRCRLLKARAEIQAKRTETLALSGVAQTRRTQTSASEAAT